MHFGNYSNEGNFLKINEACDGKLHILAFTSVYKTIRRLVIAAMICWKHSHQLAFIRPHVVQYIQTLQPLACLTVHNYYKLWHGNVKPICQIVSKRVT